MPQHIASNMGEKGYRNSQVKNIKSNTHPLSNLTKVCIYNWSLNCSQYLEFLLGKRYITSIPLYTQLKASKVIFFLFAPIKVEKTNKMSHFCTQKQEQPTFH